ncbi:MAG: DUF5597 domain-containing protein [Mucilaginibacter sp.]
MIKMLKKTTLCCAIAALAIIKTFGQAAPLPKLIEKNGRYALLVDGKPFFMLGAQVHNSSGWPGMLPAVWRAAEQMHLNTIEIPIYWEQIEPQPGKFDFSVVDKLIAESRQHKMRLVLLWFGTWKNGSNHYMPEWMKRDVAKYPNISGKNDKHIDSPSPHSSATLDADVKAFTQVMKHLKAADGQHTVIMVQVENESGAWDSMRDYSPIAQKLFEGNVPPELLKPSVLKALNVVEGTQGRWQKVFGDRADEYFHAWSVARFIGQVAAAGKAQYALPLYTNAALRDPLTNPMANTYESGGPTDNVIPIWKAAAPALDLLAPDIYLPGSERVLKVLELYNRPDNALFVPEAAFTPENAKYLYEVLAGGGIGFSPFGLDDNGRGDSPEKVAEHVAPYGHEYAVAGPMMRQLAQWAFDGKIKAVVEREDHAEQTIDLGAWQAVISFGSSRAGVVQPNKQPVGKLMIVKAGENKFIAMGTQSHITFKLTGNNAGRAWQYIKVEEGSYQNGTFKPIRILNGDETDWGGPRFGEKPVVLQIELVVR